MRSSPTLLLRCVVLLGATALTVRIAGHYLSDVMLSLLIIAAFIGAAWLAFLGMTSKHGVLHVFTLLTAVVATGVFFGVPAIRGVLRCFAGCWNWHGIVAVLVLIVVVTLLTLTTQPKRQRTAV